MQTGDISSIIGTNEIKEVFHGALQRSATVEEEICMKKLKSLNGNTKGFLRRLESLLEMVVVSILYYWTLKTCYDEPWLQELGISGKCLLMGLYGLLGGLFILNTDGFQFGNLRRFDLAMSQWIALALTNAITYFQICLMAKTMVSALPFLLLMGLEVVLVVLCVYLYAATFKWLYRPYNMILVFGSENAVNMKLKMDTRRDKYQINKLISVNRGYEAVCREILNYDAVIINDVPAQIRNDILKFCYKNSIRTYVVPKLTDIIIRGGENITSFDTPLMLMKGFGLTIVQRFLKRTMDIVLSLLAVILTLPIFAVVAIAIKLEDRGPVFYRQKRATIGGRAFDILKFRSMIVDAEKEGFSIPATGRDPRITKVGRVIRACRVDELPQIWNILKGDMSVVGPRPERLEHVEKYSNEVPEFNYRLKVRGGLTGYAQVYGKYNTTAYDKLRLDLMYIENYSLMLDIKLILMTIRIMFSKDSTEGFEKARENEKALFEILDKIHREQEETAVGRGID